jgi:hypothetical protein
MDIECSGERVRDFFMAKVTLSPPADALWRPLQIH